MGILHVTIGYFIRCCSLGVVLSGMWAAAVLCREGQRLADTPRAHVATRNWSANDMNALRARYERPSQALEKE